MVLADGVTATSDLVFGVRGGEASTDTVLKKCVSSTSRDRTKKKNDVYNKNKVNVLLLSNTNSSSKRTCHLKK